jgi:hypothetical protein
MALLVWNDPLSLRVESVDNRHTVLLDTIDELHAAIRSADPPPTVFDVELGWPSPGFPLTNC